MNFEEWFKDYRFQDGYSKGGAYDAWYFQQGRIRELTEWFKTQIDYLPEYFEALENCKDTGEAVKRVVTDNFSKYLKLMDINENN